MIKVAVPVKANNNIAEHYKQSEFYNIFTITSDNSISDQTTVEKAKGCGCKSDAVSVLSDDGVKVMLAGGIGNGATNALKSHGIEVIRGCSGDSREVVEQYLKGMIQDKGSSCNHNHHHTSFDKLVIAEQKPKSHSCQCGGNGCNHN